MLQLFTPETFSKKFSFFNPDQNFLLELVTNNDVALIVGLFKKIQEEYKGGLNSNYEVICHYVSILLIYVSRLFSASTGLHATASLKNGKAALLKAFETEVRKNLRARKQVKDYAKVLNVTAKYLSEAVKSESGKTARKVIQEIIMLEARSLLLQTSLTVTEISHRLGFSDPSHFTKMFKSKTGSTPSYFIKKK
jgi:AraC-like DNA-binding protein